MFDRIVTNALEFLTKAIEGFQSEPKHSIINFYTAVELFLKARLLHEHWSLVVLKEPDFDLFEKGDFVSVPFDVACQRLDKVARTPIPIAAKRNFDAIRRHRNRIVHFSHDIDSKDHKVVEAIAREQLRAWFDLHQLLTVQWKSEFAMFGKNFAAIEEKLSGHRDYLLAKYNGLKSEIKRRLATGGDFRLCQACGFGAMEADCILGDLLEGKCLVCNYTDRWIDFACGKCDAISPLKDGGLFECDHCGDSMNEIQIANALDEFVATPDNYLDAVVPANCGECEGFHAVVEYQEKYLCVLCLDISEALQRCEFCGDHSSGNLEQSYLSGCTSCEGSAGWHKDD